MLKEHVFHVPLDATLSEIVMANLWLPFVFFGAIIGLFYLAKYLVKKLPPKDWRFRLNREATKVTAPLQQKAKLTMAQLFSKQLLEKVVLITFVTTIFSQIVPDLRVHMLYLGLGVCLIIVANTLVSQFIHDKGFKVKNSFLEFLVILVMNIAIFNVLDFFSTKVNSGRLSLGALFFLYILSIIVALYDWYRDDYEYRFKQKVA